MELWRSVFCVVLLLSVFCIFPLQGARRGGRRDTLVTLQGELRALGETQEEVRGDMAALQRSVNALTDLVTAMLPEDCWAAKVRGSRGRHLKVKPPGMPPREVLCDQVTEGGGWTVVLARYNTTANHTERENFNRTWKEYREGFGNTQGEFWIGNEILHALTNQTPHQLYVSLGDWEGNTARGLWNHFQVAGEADKYQLSVNEYMASSSTIGDSLKHHHHRAFSTYDRDNDTDEHRHCSKSYGGGWWYFRCHTSHLTGAALPPGGEGHHAITWRDWKHNKGLQSAFMAIRPPPSTVYLDL